MGVADDFGSVFERLSALYRRLEPLGVLLQDEPQRYALATQEMRARDVYRTWFGGVEIKKTYVSARLMAVYVYPGLLSRLSPALRRRMQGKSCCNFRVMDEELFAELNELIQAVRNASKATADCSATGLRHAPRLDEPATKTGVVMLLSGDHPMPAKSAAQEKAAGAALAAKRGEIPKSKLKGASKQMEQMSEKQLEAFADTKRKGKPEHVAK